MVTFTFSFCPPSQNISKSSSLPQFRGAIRLINNKNFILERAETFENENFSLKDSLMKKTNNAIKSNKCKQCDYASSNTVHLRGHFKTHNGEKLNKCNQCDYASSQARSLRAHLKTHSGEKSNKCNQCEYASSQAACLRRHLKTHTGKS